MDVVWVPCWSPQEDSLTRIQWPWSCLDDYHEPDNCFELKPPSPWLRVTNNRSVWNAARRWQSLGSGVSQYICEVVSTVEAWGRSRILNKQLPFLPKWQEPGCQPWAFRGSAFARKVKPGGLRTAVRGVQQEACGEGNVIWNSYTPRLIWGTFHSWTCRRHREKREPCASSRAEALLGWWIPNLATAPGKAHSCQHLLPPTI